MFARSPKQVKEEETEDDPLTYLCELFGEQPKRWSGWCDKLAVRAGTTRLDGSDEEEEEEEEEEESDTESEGFVPSSPCAKYLDEPFIAISPQKKTYFYALGQLYYFDEDRNVYLDNSPDEGKLLHYGKLMLDNDLTDMLQPDFFIDGVPYFFDHMGALLYQDHTGLRSVCTWTSDTLAFEQALSATFMPRTTGSALQSNYPIEFEYQPEPGPYMQQMAVAAGGYWDEPKREIVESHANSLGNSLGSSFRGAGAVPWSPGSSIKSPIVGTASRAPSEGFEPLIEAGQGPGWIAGIQVWQQQTKNIQRAQQPSNKMDRRRCPQCNKVFRRPSSLEDHLNVHSGEKPHVCPYKSCKTGFATKSNMKRHFLTHRVGTLEEYNNGIKVEKTKSRTVTYNSKAFHTQRFRLTT